MILTLYTTSCLPPPPLESRTVSSVSRCGPPWSVWTLLTTPVRQSSPQEALRTVSRLRGRSESYQDKTFQTH